jgi:hypothetical protein
VSAFNSRSRTRHSVSSPRDRDGHGRSSCVDRRRGSSLSPPLQHDSLAHRPGHRSKVHVTVHSLSDIVVTEDRSLARYRIARGPDIESPQRGPAPRYPRANPAKISRAMIARGAPETLGSGHSRTHRAIRRNAGGNAHGACDGTRTSAPRAVHSSAVRCRERTYCCMWLRLTRSTPRSWVLACRLPAARPDRARARHEPTARSRRRQPRRGARSWRGCTALVRRLFQTE